jgi:predicted metal-dependent HD superfamily phosphohydrolase
MKIGPDILRETALYVEAYMKEHFDEHLVFHNYQHTLKVVRVADSIAADSDLSKQERSLVHLAAWFNDIGYEQGARDHEIVSAAHARKFFESKGLDKDDIQAIESAILSTRTPQQPQHMLGRILCDADMFHLGDHSFLDKLDLLRMEMEHVNGKPYTDLEWYQMNVNLISHHHFFTPFARKQFDKEKKNNLLKLRAELSVLKNATHGNKQPVQMDDDDRNLFDQSTKFDRGVETLFRLTSGNHMELGAMGDNKANILISINTLILGIIFTVVGTKLDQHPYLLVPSILLCTVSITTVVLAVLSTRPKITKGKFTPQQIIKREANLLFFGNFHDMPLGEYKSAVKEMMIDKEYLYESLIQDIYYMGKVLAKKYRFVTWAYNTFMIGLIVSVIAMIISFAFFAN